MNIETIFKFNPSKHLPNPPQGGNSFLSLLFISFSIKKISFHSFTHFLFSQSPSFLVSKKVKRLCVALSTPTTSKNLCVSLCKNIFISLRQAQDDNRVKQISKNLSYLILKITPISLIRVPKNSTFVTRELCSNWRSNHYSTLKTPETPLKSPQGDNSFKKIRYHQRFASANPLHQRASLYHAISSKPYP